MEARNDALESDDVELGKKIYSLKVREGHKMHQTLFSSIQMTVCRCLSIVALFSVTSAAAQQTFTVDRLTDTGDGEGFTGDLRYCISNASDGDTITFELPGTIYPTRALPNLTRSINIEGPGANLVAVAGRLGGPSFRIFTVINTTARISGLTIADSAGGGIYNSGNLTLDACTISGSGYYSAGGGGIHNTGTLAIRDSTIAGNWVGGGVFGSCYGSMGGGIYNQGYLTISNTTISGNRAHCTICIFGCEDIGFGGAVDNEGTLVISNSTVANNSADSVGGIGAGVLYMRNSIVAGNGTGSGADLSGRLASSGYNLIGDSRGASGFDETDLLDVNPLLGPLQDNGGPTPTHALLTGSPAIDAGDPEFVGPPDFDQRGDGFDRIVNGIVDIGAFEVQAE